MRALPAEQQRDFLVDSGYLVPHWPKPWGRAADVLEQLVIEEEFADVERPDMGITGWVTLTIAQAGNDDQRERWVEPVLRGQVMWCQLFSEPGAGSDAAAVRTSAKKVDGGWRVTGQKVWTSLAHQCQWGLATVRTDPDAPKHAGVTMMAIDMKAPGVTVNPLRGMTGSRALQRGVLRRRLRPRRRRGRRREPGLAGRARDAGQRADLDRRRLLGARPASPPTT